MRPFLLVVLALALLAPTHAARTDVEGAFRASGVEFTLPHGRTFSSAELADMIAGAPRRPERAVDGMSPGRDLYVGDIWVWAVGVGPCSIQVLGPGSPVSYPLHPNFWIYEGETALMGGSERWMFVYNWNLHVSALYEPGHWQAAGSVDWSCLERDGQHLVIAFMNGVVEAGDGP